MIALPLFSSSVISTRQEDVEVFRWSYVRFMTLFLEEAYYLIYYQYTIKSMLHLASQIDINLIKNFLCFHIQKVQKSLPIDSVLSQLNQLRFFIIDFSKKHCNITFYLRLCIPNRLFPLFIPTTFYAHFMFASPVPREQINSAPVRAEECTAAVNSGENCQVIHQQRRVTDNAPDKHVAVGQCCFQTASIEG